MVSGAGHERANRKDLGQMKMIKNCMIKLQSSEAVRYVVTGGITTAINYFIYILLNLIGADWLVSNCVAWVGAVVFAFFANKHVVFHSDGNKGKEFMGFISVRLATLLLENALLYIFIDCLFVGEFFSKVVVSVVTVALNYLACKYGIFIKGGVTHE